MQPVHRMRADASNDLAQVGLGLQAVERGRTDQRVEEGGSLASGVTAGEEPIFSSEGHGSDGVLGRVVADLQLAVIDVGGERCPPARAAMDVSRLRR
jgi:hypothetical protein